MQASPDSLPRALNSLLARLQRDGAARYENRCDWRVDGVIREYASLHALLDLQVSQIDERLALLAAYSGKCYDHHTGKEHVLAIRRQDGTYDVRESVIVAELADLHVALGSSLEAAVVVFRDHFGEIETAVILAHLADEHRKDAIVLRALLWEDKPQ